VRLLDRLDELYAIGGGEGANRPAYSPEEDEAHDRVAAWMADAGLEVERDASGNLLGRLPGERPDLPEVWTGSHLDSVPRGGRFDGPLGVVGGLEAVERAGRQERTLAVVAFRGEEVGCLGSRARVEAGELPGVWVELHIEQGPVLARADAPLGVVTGIVGYARADVSFAGTAGHAGTTPMDARDDALVRAAEYVLRVRDAAGDDAVATVGRVTVEPGAANVIPGRAVVAVDARALEPARLDRLVADLALEPHMRVEPVAMSERVRAALRDAAAARGVAAPELPSGAGHDAGILAAAGVESGMLFVRSLAGGVSHSPHEHSDADDLALAVDVLAEALARLAGAPSES
jgi:acetylornithine deacetylase/succinyl-diaminopimelate desuccinylase-like protein